MTPRARIPLLTLGLTLTVALALVACDTGPAAADTDDPPPQRGATGAGADAQPAGPALTDGSVERIQVMVAAINRTLQAVAAARPVTVRTTALLTPSDAPQITRRIDARLPALLNQLAGPLALKFTDRDAALARTPYELTGSLIPLGDDGQQFILRLALVGPTADAARSVMWEDTALLEVE